MIGGFCEHSDERSCTIRAGQCFWHCGEGDGSVRLAITIQCLFRECVVLCLRSSYTPSWLCSVSIPPTVLHDLTLCTAQGRVLLKNSYGLKIYTVSVVRISHVLCIAVSWLLCLFYANSWTGHFPTLAAVYAGLYYSWAETCNVQYSFCYNTPKSFTLHLWGVERKCTRFSHPFRAVVAGIGIVVFTVLMYKPSLRSACPGSYPVA
jgi:hypothetical protein